MAAHFSFILSKVRVTVDLETPRYKGAATNAIQIAELLIQKD